MSLKRKKSKVSLSVIFIIITLIAFSIANSSGSFAINIYTAEREADMKVVSNKNAFIGIDYEDSYTVTKGEQISLFVQNNLPYAVDYTVSLEGKPILNITPTDFKLESNEKKQEIIINIDKKIDSGIYNVQGIISALFDKGQSDVSIDFKVKIE